MPLIPYRSPDDPAFVVLDRSRFRVEHGTFLLDADALRSRLAQVLETHPGPNLPIPKLAEEYRRLLACVDWLDSLDPPDWTHSLDPRYHDLVVPPFEHEPAIGQVLDPMVDAGEFPVAHCPGCDLPYVRNAVSTIPWEFGDEVTTVRGRNIVCPKGHILHARADAIDVS